MSKKLKLIRCHHNKTYIFKLSVDKTGLFDFRLKIEHPYYGNGGTMLASWEPEYLNCSLTELVEDIIPRKLEMLGRG